MRRQRRMQQNTENDYDSSINYAPLNSDSNRNDDFLLMERATELSNKQAHRFENTIEAKVEEGDTLQALALRFHCTVADIKRLNKIDKDNEIHARKVIKIPVTVHSVLLGSLPTVHTSGNSSPKRLQDREPDITRNPLEEASALLDEKLLVAAVSSVTNNSSQNVNNVVMNSKIASASLTYRDEEPSTSRAGDKNDATLPLISDILDDQTTPHMRQIPGPSMMALDWSGSDCDMSWICLFIGILALCFVIPLIYVIYLAEHPHHHNPHHNMSSVIDLS